ncbi:3-deoxy-D-manno-octulosonic acid transferase [Algicella marina]|uniref:3-deoxy-D-manno-octulosonic acid transferase n=1 Tax=Algicella marina TaxID=2683284 RepID=A0A6P1T434_9RHOB|nr:3-deoxy-D-manno-octulosonic acid transferase [Algicella marina]QHQ36767.1 3-deoxy-D-manno-octulosonic acid transferase [Algicella marina]
MRRSLGLGLYLFASWLAFGTARRMVKKRLDNGKEHETRHPERLGTASLPRPKGPLIWLHAASVGEALSLLDLVDRILKRRPDVHVLVTTGTVTSAELMEKRLPERAMHQFVPVDAARVVKRFLNHWRPDVAVWTESELWPALIHHTHRTGCPMYLVNARMSERSARRLHRSLGLGRAVLQRFRRILAQDETAAVRFVYAGAPPEIVEITGSLKESAMPLPVDEAALKSFSGKLAGKQIWLAASTHPGEEEIVSAAHRQARRTAHGLILILVPRHPERGSAVAKELRAAGWRVAQRSAGEELTRDTEIYLADTMGEMGLWYRLAPVSFVGGSLVEVGGHNPYEPGLLGSAILHGPYVHNFEAAYESFHAANAAVRVPRGDELGRSLVETLPADRTAALAANAWRVTSDGTDTAQMLCDLLTAELPQAQDAA